MNTADCPSFEVLQSYGEGQLSDDQAERVGQHLDTCSTCRAHTENALPLPLPVSSARLPFSGEAGNRRAIEQICQLIDTRVDRTQSELRLPARLRNYELLQKIGQGGMGVVYLARHLRLDRLVAVKVLSTQRHRHDESLRRFQREMKAVGQLDHPNLVRGLDADIVDELPFLVMEHIRGLDLSRIVHGRGPLPVPEACELIRQTAVGLDHAHRRGLVHRDIKPSNIMLVKNEDGEFLVKVLDMGLAQFAHQIGLDELTGEGQTMGTLEYMAPEQSEDSHIVDARADVYSLGCTLYKLLCGEPPFPANRYPTPIKLLRALATESVPPIAAKRQLPIPLAQLINTMLARDPDKRPTSAAEVAERLQPFAQGFDFSTFVDSYEETSDAVSETAQHIPSCQQRPDQRADTVNQTDVSTQAKQNVANRPHRPRLGNFRRRLLVLSTLIVLIAVVTLLIPGKNGFIKIEILDPSIQVTVNGANRYLVTDQNSKFEIEDGEHRLHIHAGGISFQTQEFTVTRNETLVLRVSQVDGNKLQVHHGEQLLDEFALTAKNNDVKQVAIKPNAEKKASTPGETDVRAIAEAILEAGGDVRVLLGSRHKDIVTGMSLPKQSFQLIGFTLRKGGAPPGLFQDLPGLPDLEFVTINQVPLDDSLLDALSQTRLTGLVYYAPPELTLREARAVAKIAGLQRLNLSGQFVSAEIIETLSPLKKLNRLNLHGAKFDDKTIDKVTQFKSLTFLNMFGTRVSEKALQQLKKLNQLEMLYLNQTYEQGLIVSRMLPDCLVNCKSPDGQQIVGLRNGALVQPFHSTDRDVAVATAILKAKGSIEIVHGEKRQMIDRESKLPKGNFKLVRIKVCRSPILSSLIDQLPQLDHLEILEIEQVPLDNSLLNAIANTRIVELGVETHRSPLTSEQGRYIAKTRSLRHLRLFGQFVSAELIEALAPLKELKILTLYASPFNEQTVVQITQFAELEVLDISASPLPESVFPHLAKLKKLKKLHARISFDSAMKLSLMLPRCQISYLSDDGKRVFLPRK